MYRPIGRLLEMKQIRHTFNSIKAIFVLPCILLCLALILTALLSTEYTFASERGPAKINGVLYFLNSEGKPAKSGRERTLKCGGKTYYVLKSGRIKKGWNVIGKNLYYFSKKSGAMVIGWYKLFPPSSLVDPTLTPLTRRASQSSLESSTGPSRSA